MAGFLAPPGADPFRGRKLGKYEVVSRLSTGGMSEIFLAFQTGVAGFRKPVVLKQILQDIKSDEEFVRMFLDEAKITAAFTHPNIAQVFDLDVQEGELFLAMEFIPGVTLVDVAKACHAAREAIPIGFSLAVVRDTALALHYAHTFTDPTGKPQQVIHRDIAEKNIMVTYEGVTKLLDFGIAKRMGSAGRTIIGTVKGTSGYMSPEQVLGERLDPRSDVFSLGVVLHELFTNTRLFFGKDAEEELMAPVNSRAVPPSRRNAAVTAALDEVVMRALQRKREARPASARDLARDVERAGEGLLWDTEQCGAFLRSRFKERREQTALLLEAAQAEGGDGTGFTKVAALLGTLGHGRVVTPTPVAVTKAPPPGEGARITAVVQAPKDRPPLALDESSDSSLRTAAERPHSRFERELTTPDFQEPSTLPPEAPPGRPLEDAAVMHSPALVPWPPNPRPNAPPVDTNNGEGPTVMEGARAPFSPIPEQTANERPPGPRGSRANLAASASTLPADRRPAPRLGDEPVTQYDWRGDMSTEGGTPESPPKRRWTQWLVFLASLLLAGAVALAMTRLGARSSQRGQTNPTTLVPAQEMDAGEGRPGEADPAAPDAVSPPKTDAGEGRPGEADPAAPDAVSPPKRSTPRERVRRGEPRRRAAEGREALTGPTGQLTLVSEPYSHVYLGEKSLGPTPLFEVTLPAGKSSLRLLGPDRKRRVLEVEVRAGEVTKLRVSLSSLGTE